jgi:Fe-S-cluster containining protein
MPHEGEQHGEWFDPDGLRFACTMCGNCCSGPPGYVHVNDKEVGAIAQHLMLSVGVFEAEYCVTTSLGRSLREVRSEHGHDCVFLDRVSQPGRAVCGVYEARPAQCRAWPFWPSLLRSRSDWERAGRTCPGIGKGDLHGVERIQLVRATIEGRLDPSR